MGWVRGDLVGGGSDGAVYCATFPELGKVAVKSANIVDKSRLEKEQRILSVFKECKQIVDCHGCNESNERHVRVFNLILEYARGGSLKDIIQDYKNKINRNHASLRHETVVPESVVRKFTRMILRGLSCIHKKGYVHCDVKPENILAFPVQGDFPFLKLADFGRSKEPESEQNCLKLGYRGTPQYMSPESIMGDIDTSLDIWSLGCTVIHMFTGNLPWSTEDCVDLMGRILYTDETPEIPEAISKLAKDFLRKCLVRNHTERWSADMLLNHPFVAEDSWTSVFTSFLSFFQLFPTSRSR